MTTSTDDGGRVTTGGDADPRDDLEAALWHLLGVLALVVWGCVRQLWWVTSELGGLPAFGLAAVWLVVAAWRLSRWWRLRKVRER